MQSKNGLSFPLIAILFGNIKATVSNCSLSHILNSRTTAKGNKDVPEIKELHRREGLEAMSFLTLEGRRMRGRYDYYFQFLNQILRRNSSLKSAKKDHGEVRAKMMLEKT